MAGQDFYVPDVRLEPYWWEAVPRPGVSETRPPSQVDVVVVGSGYTGLSAALTLLRAGRSVAILEAGELGQGASTRNGGAVGETLRISFSGMVKQFGCDQAVAFYIGAREARAHLDQLLEGERIECHYARVGRFIGAHKRSDYEMLARDLEQRKRAIGFDADMVPASDMPRVIGSNTYFGGRLIHTDGNLHPGLFHQALLNRVLGAGAAVVTRIRVTDIARDGAMFRLTTSAGRFAARDVIVATNGYTGSESPWLRRGLIPIQSQIIATEPLPEPLIDRLIPQRRQMGDTRKLHNYYRTSPEGRRILFGGRAGGSSIGDMRRSGMHLRRQMVDIFPELAEVRITHSWAGFIAYTFDSLPHIATYEGIHYPAGFCGSGVAMAPYLGHKAALKVLGSTEAATPFDRLHPRPPVYGGRPWFMPAVLFYFGMRDRLRL